MYKLTKEEALNIIANNCENWSKEELLTFVFDRLYTEHENLSVDTLNTIVENLIKTVSNKDYLSQITNTFILPEKY